MTRANPTYKYSSSPNPAEAPAPGGYTVIQVGVSTENNRGVDDDSSSTNGDASASLYDIGAICLGILSTII